MSDVDELDADELLPHNGDASARDLVNAAKLDTNHSTLRGRLNELVRALDDITRDDNTLKDSLVRSRNLHPEILQRFGVGGNTVNIYQTVTGPGGEGGSGIGYSVKADEFGAIGDGFSHPLSIAEAAEYNTSFGSYGLSVSTGDERDWAGIQAALYKAMSTGNRVHLPPGLYRINKPLDYSARTVPLTGQPSIPPAIIVTGEGYKTEVKGYGIAENRAVWEFLGANNGVNVRIELRDMRITHDPATCHIGSWCVRLGDTKTGSRLAGIWMEGACGLRIKFATTASYANSCTSMERVYIRTNYANGWALPAASTCLAVGAEDGNARADNIKFDSCYFLGPLVIKAMVAVFTNCLLSNINDSAGIYGRCITVNGGSLQLFGSYFEAYTQAVYAEATVFHIDQILAVGCLFNGGGGLVTSTYAMVGVYNASFNFGRMSIISCHASVPSHTVACVRWDGVGGNLQDCNQRNLAGDWTIQVANGAKVMTLNNGKITSYEATSGGAAFVHSVSVDGSTGMAHANTSTGTAARYAKSIIVSGTTYGITVFGQNYSVSALRKAVYHGNSAGPHVWGVGGALDMILNEFSRLLIGSATVDDLVNRVQITGGLRLAPQSGNNNVDGSVWSDSVNRSLKTRHAETRTSIPGVLGVGYSDRTVGNTNVESTLLPVTFAGGVGLGGAYLAAGKVVRVKLSGFITNTGTPSLQIRVYLGSKVVGNTGIVTMVTISGTRRWEMTLDIVVRVDGVAGETISQGELSYFSSASAKNYIPMVSTVAVTGIDMIAAMSLGVTATWGAADALNTMTCTQAVVEVLN